MNVDILYKHLITDTLKFNEIVDIIYDNLLTENKDAKYVKIRIHFIVNNNTIKRVFFYRQKSSVDRYLYNIFLYQTYNNFKEKFLDKNFPIIDKYHIEIIYKT